MVQHATPSPFIPIPPGEEGWSGRLCSLWGPRPVFGTKCVFPALSPGKGSRQQGPPHHVFTKHTKVNLCSATVPPVPRSVINMVGSLMQTHALLQSAHFILDTAVDGGDFGLLEVPKDSHIAKSNGHFQRCY